MIKRLLRTLYKSSIQLASANWKPYSHLIIAGDTAGWVLDWEMRELSTIATRLGIQTTSQKWQHSTTPQSIFFASQYFLNENTWLSLPHRIGFAYFHGLPNTGDTGFDKVYSQLVQHHNRINRIQVSHTEMQKAVLQSGIDPEKVFLIPIGVNLDFFHYQNTQLRHLLRKRLEIPDDAFVVGSFQKDGVGWGDGMEPKLIKGPDIFVETLALARKSIPNLFVLLTGPARGYVKEGLKRIGIPFRHLYLKNYPEVGELFSTLDLYLVSARQEGGPKAILEAMASGVPLVTTRVGQAMDLVRHGQNGWITEVGAVNELEKWVTYVYEHQGAIQTVLENGRKTAEANTYTSQTHLWKKFLKGFVE